MENSLVDTYMRIRKANDLLDIYRRILSQKSRRLTADPEIKKHIQVSSTGWAWVDKSIYYQTKAVRNHIDKIKKLINDSKATY